MPQYFGQIREKCLFHEVISCVNFLQKLEEKATGFMFLSYLYLQPYAKYVESDSRMDSSCQFLSTCDLDLREVGQRKLWSSMILVALQWMMVMMTGV